jgi:hypothetical protein
MKFMRLTARYRSTSIGTYQFLEAPAVIIVTTTLIHECLRSRVDSYSIQPAHVSSGHIKLQAVPHLDLRLSPRAEVGSPL